MDDSLDERLAASALRRAELVRRRDELLATRSEASQRRFAALAIEHALGWMAPPPTESQAAELHEVLEAVRAYAGGTIEAAALSSAATRAQRIADAIGDYARRADESELLYDAFHAIAVAAFVAAAPTEPRIEAAPDTNDRGDPTEAEADFVFSAPYVGDQLSNAAGDLATFQVVGRRDFTIPYGHPDACVARDDASEVELTWQVTAAGQV